MKRFVSSSGSLCAFVCLGLVAVSLSAAGQQPAAKKKLRNIKMFTLQQDGTLSDIPVEQAFSYEEQSGVGSVASSRSTSEFVRLPNGSAKTRYSAGQPIRIFALIPESVDVRQLELLVFSKRGDTRITYLGQYGKESEKRLNTLSFRANKLKDGWLLEPVSQLGQGEYCFSPRFNNDNFCFGVDKE